jgi:hypothetical protein
MDCQPAWLQRNRHPQGIGGACGGIGCGRFLVGHKLPQREMQAVLACEPGRIVKLGFCVQWPPCLLPDGGRRGMESRMFQSSLIKTRGLAKSMLWGQPRAVAFVSVGRLPLTKADCANVAAI